MPRMKSEIYEAHMENLLRLAAREGGVSRPQLVQELNIARPTVIKMIEKAGLISLGKEGRTEFFGLPSVKRSTPTVEIPEVEEAAVPANDDPVLDLGALMQLDDRIEEHRQNLVRAAEAVSDHALNWALAQSAFDGMRAEMVALIKERAALSK